MTKKIVNCITGEEIEVELSAEDLAQQEIDTEAYEEKEAAKAAVQTKKQEIAAKLGLTADEVAALLA
jgi:hypothetical protein